MPQGTIVSVSAQSSSTPASYAIDGISDVPSSRWSASGMPQNLVVDLGKVYDVTRFEVFPSANRAYRYKIDGSLDGGSFTTLVDRSQNTTPGLSINDDIPAATARYIRLTVTGASGYTGGWVSIQEIKCFGVPNTDPQIIDSDLLITGGLRVNAGLDLVSRGMNIYKNEALYTAEAAPEIEFGYDINETPVFKLFAGDPTLTTSPGVLIDPANNALTFQNMDVAISGSLSLNGDSLLTTGNAATALAGHGFLTNDGTSGISLTKPVSEGETNTIVLGYGATSEGTNTTVIGNDETTLTRLRGATNLDSLNVAGATNLQGQVTIQIPQGDISMGIYQ